MKNKFNRSIFFIFLFICIAITSTTITIKTFLQLNLLPAATGVLIDGEINKVSEMTDMKLLKKYIIEELRSKEHLVHVRDAQFKFIFLLGILTVLISVLGIFLSLRLLRKPDKDAPFQHD